MDVRPARAGDAEAIRRFADVAVTDHYTPLIGANAARAQVRDWWTSDRLGVAAADGRLVVARDEDDVVGVGEWSLVDGTPVIWKLYVSSSHRGKGYGRRLLEAIQDQLPEGVKRVQVEHFAVNVRAGDFYEREGFNEIRRVTSTTPELEVVWREKLLSPEDRDVAL